jgi:Na+/melibiose symporter-like transporter
MRFSGTEKSIAHGGSMLGFAIGAAIAPWLARLLDKKGAVLLGAVLSVVCNVMLALLFSTGLVSTHAHWLAGGVDVPVSLILFVLFHASYWLGNGILVPISTAMMADVAELNLLRTGENKDGGYASVFSFAIRLATSIGLYAAGCALTWTGYKTLSDTTSNAPIVQTPQALWNLGMAMFMIGAGIAGIACLTILKYPISRQYLENMRKRAPVHA